MTVSASSHVPVLPAEVLRYLDPKPGETFVDATVGSGGHARLIAERIAPNGLLIGLDRDASMLELARNRLSQTSSPPFEGGAKHALLHRNFDELRATLDELGIEAVDGILADLGFSSAQMDDPKRGLSFTREGPLDMRLDPTIGEPAFDLIRRLSEPELADLIYEFGEERFSRRIARAIVETRKKEPIETTTQLAELVRRCVPRSKGLRIDPATRTFQALRIAVNDELGALDRFLEQLPGCLKPGGRVAIISFHSLEDRKVKQAFRNKDVYQVLTKKPVQATEEEVRSNPRSRSAKLRVAIKIV